MRLVGNRILVYYKELMDNYEVSKSTIDNGINAYRSGNSNKWQCGNDGNVFIYLDTIPTKTRAKLPSDAQLLAIIKDNGKNALADRFYKVLSNAMASFGRHKAYYKSEYGLDGENLTTTAMKRALWEKLLEIHTESGKLDAIFNAYNKAWNVPYASKHVLSREIKRAKEFGLDAVCVDNRQLSNFEGHNKKFNELHMYYLATFTSSGKAYKTPELHKMMQEACAKSNIACPSVSWVKHRSRDLIKSNIEIYESRYGADKADKKATYSKLQQALYANDQWQIDGWELPFYYLADKDGKRSLKKLTLVTIIDTYSRKIIGYDIAETENRLSLMSAFEQAVSNTGALPFELITDNHSYNKTNEIKNFKAELEALGVTWTVDENPKRKVVIERGFKKLAENHCKRYPGYIGQGIKTRDKDGRSKQELIDKYQRSGDVLDVKRIHTNGIAVVEAFNRTVAASSKKSPDELYQDSEKPNQIQVDIYDSLRLFSLETECKIRNYQITMQMAGTKYEYALPAEHYKLDQQKVRIRYYNPDTIYLFDKNSDKAICSLRQKRVMHAALANQTPADIDNYNKATATKKAIKSKSKKDLQSITGKALEINPAAYDTANAILMPKDALKELREMNATDEAIKRGIDLNRIPIAMYDSELENADLKPQLSKKEKSPFTPDNHKISIIQLDEY